MEFSERFELNRIAKIGDCLLCPSKLQIRYRGSTQLEYNTILSDNDENQDFLKDSSDYCPESKFLPLPKASINFTIEKDNSFLNENHNCKRSSLTTSLMQEDDKSPMCMLQQLKVEVYFFSSPLKIKLTLPTEITISGLLSKALLALSRSNFSAMPNGLDANGYEVW